MNVSNAIVPLSTGRGAPIIFGANVNLLTVLRNGMCRDLNDIEFSTFIHIVDHTALDPIRGQIMPVLFHRDKPNKRRMVAITTINGYRTIADRTGTYAPSAKAPRVVAKETLKDAKSPRSKNPGGLVSVTVWGKKLVHGEWHEFSAKANWAEYAPYINEWQYDRALGQDVIVDKYMDKVGKWFTGSEMMLTKCAYASLMRIGWPDDYGGNLYDPAEIDRWKTIDLMPHEFARIGETAIVARARSGPDIRIRWSADMDEEIVPAGVLIERIGEFIHMHEDDVVTLALFREVNRRALTTDYFAYDKAKYHDMVKLFLPYEDRYHGRRATSFGETFAARQAERPEPQKKSIAKRPRQEYSSGDKRHVSHDDGVLTSIEPSNERWERLP